MLSFGSLLGLPLNMEIFLLTLVGIVTTSLDTSIFNIHENLKHVWSVPLPEPAIPKWLHNPLRIIMTTIAMVRSCTTHLHLACYIIMLYPILCSERPSLLLPWLIVGAIKHILMSLLSLGTGMVICVNMDQIKDVCVYFVAARILEVTPAIYMWSLVYSLYYDIRAEATSQTEVKLNAAEALEQSVRRRKARLMEESLHVTKAPSSMVTSSHSTYITLTRSLDTLMSEMPSGVDLTVYPEMERLSTAQKTQHMLGLTDVDILRARRSSTKSNNQTIEFTVGPIKYQGNNPMGAQCSTDPVEKLGNAECVFVNKRNHFPNNVTKKKVFARFSGSVYSFPYANQDSNGIMASAVNKFVTVLKEDATTSPDTGSDKSIPETHRICNESRGVNIPSNQTIPAKHFCNTFQQVPIIEPECTYVETPSLPQKSMYIQEGIGQDFKVIPSTTTQLIIAQSGGKIQNITSLESSEDFMPNTTSEDLSYAACESNEPYDSDANDASDPDLPSGSSDKAAKGETYDPLSDNILSAVATLLNSQKTNMNSTEGNTTIIIRKTSSMLVVETSKETAKGNVFEKNRMILKPDNEKISDAQRNERKKHNITAVSGNRKSNTKIPPCIECTNESIKCKKCKAYRPKGNKAASYSRKLDLNLPDSPQENRHSSYVKRQDHWRDPFLSNDCFNSKEPVKQRTFENASEYKRQEFIKTTTNNLNGARAGRNIARRIDNERYGTIAENNDDSQMYDIDKQVRCYKQTVDGAENKQCRASCPINKDKRNENKIISLCGTSKSIRDQLSDSSKVKQCENVVVEKPEDCDGKLVCNQSEKGWYSIGIPGIPVDNYNAVPAAALPTTVEPSETPPLGGRPSTSNVEQFNEKQMEMQAMVVQFRKCKNSTCHAGVADSGGTTTASNDESLSTDQEKNIQMEIADQLRKCENSTCPAVKAAYEGTATTATSYNDSLLSDRRRRLQVVNVDQYSTPDAGKPAYGTASTATSCNENQLSGGERNLQAEKFDQSKNDQYSTPEGRKSVYEGTATTATSYNEGQLSDQERMFAKKVDQTKNDQNSTHVEEKEAYEGTPANYNESQLNDQETKLQARNVNQNNTVEVGKGSYEGTVTTATSYNDSLLSDRERKVPIGKVDENSARDAAKTPYEGTATTATSYNENQLRDRERRLQTEMVDVSKNDKNSTRDGEKTSFDSSTTTGTSYDENLFINQEEIKQVTPISTNDYGDNRRLDQTRDRRTEEGAVSSGKEQFGKTVVSVATGPEESKISDQANQKIETVKTTVDKSQVMETAADQFKKSDGENDVTIDRTKRELYGNEENRPTSHDRGQVTDKHGISKDAVKFYKGHEGTSSNDEQARKKQYQAEEGISLPRSSIEMSEIHVGKTVNYDNIQSDSEILLNEVKKAQYKSNHRLSSDKGKTSKGHDTKQIMPQKVVRHTDKIVDDDEQLRDHDDISLSPSNISESGQAINRVATSVSNEGHFMVHSKTSSHLHEARKPTSTVSDEVKRDINAGKKTVKNITHFREEEFLRGTVSARGKVYGDCGGGKTIDLSDKLNKEQQTSKRNTQSRNGDQPVDVIYTENDVGNQPKNAEAPTTSRMFIGSRKKIIGRKNLNEEEEREKHTARKSFRKLGSAESLGPVDTGSEENMRRTDRRQNNNKETKPRDGEKDNTPHMNGQGQNRNRDREISSRHVSYNPESDKDKTIVTDTPGNSSSTSSENLDDVSVQSTSEFNEGNLSENLSDPSSAFAIDTVALSSEVVIATQDYEAQQSRSICDGVKKRRRRPPSDSSDSSESQDDNQKVVKKKERFPKYTNDGETRKSVLVIRNEGVEISSYKLPKRHGLSPIMYREGGTQSRLDQTHSNKKIAAYVPPNPNDDTTEEEVPSVQDTETQTKRDAVKMPPKNKYDGSAVVEAVPNIAYNAINYLFERNKNELDKLDGVEEIIRNLGKETDDNIFTTDNDREKISGQESSSLNIFNYDLCQFGSIPCDLPLQISYDDSLALQKFTSLVKIPVLKKMCKPERLKPLNDLSSPPKKSEKKFDVVQCVPSEKEDYVVEKLSMLSKTTADINVNNLSFMRDTNSNESDKTNISETSTFIGSVLYSNAYIADAAVETSSHCSEKAHVTREYGTQSDPVKIESLLFNLASEKSVENAVVSTSPSLEIKPMYVNASSNTKPLKICSAKMFEDGNFSTIFVNTSGDSLSTSTSGNSEIVAALKLAAQNNNSIVKQKKKSKMADSTHKLKHTVSKEMVVIKPPRSLTSSDVENRFINEKSSEAGCQASTLSKEFLLRSSFTKLKKEKTTSRNSK